MFKQLFVLFLVAMMFGSSMQQFSGGFSGAIPAGPAANPGLGGASTAPVAPAVGTSGSQVGAGAKPAGGVAGGAANQGQGLGGSWGFGK